MENSKKKDEIMVNDNTVGLPTFDEYLKSKLDNESKNLLSSNEMGCFATLVVLGIFIFVAGVICMIESENAPEVGLIFIFLGIALLVVSLSFKDNVKKKKIAEITKQAESEYNQLFIQSQYSEDEFKTTKSFVLADINDFILLDSNKKSFIVRLN